MEKEKDEGYTAVHRILRKPSRTYLVTIPLESITAIGCEEGDLLEIKIKVIKKRKDMPQKKVVVEEKKENNEIVL